MVAPCERKRRTSRRQLKWDREELMVVWIRIVEMRRRDQNCSLDLVCHLNG